MLDTYMNALDLTFLSISRLNGQELPVLPGFLAQNPPQKPARGRDQDRLVVFLTLTGNVNYSAADYNEIVSQVAGTFYDTPGSLTFALKTAAEWLNTTLADRNMKSTGKGLYCNASLVLCTLRGNSLYVVQAGPTHVYHIGTETRHLFDPELAGKGLGLGQSARMYFSQVTLSPGDRLLLCASLPPNWDKSLTESRGSAAIEVTRRRLLAITDANVNAVVLLATEGRGMMNALKTAQNEPIETGKPAAVSSDIAPEKSIADNPAPTGETNKPDATIGQPAPVIKESGPGSRVSIPGKEISPSDGLIMEPAVIAQDNSQPASKPPAPRNLPDPSVGQSFSKVTAPALKIDREAVNKQIQTIAGYLARFIQVGRVFTQKVTAWTERTIPKLLPETYEEQPLSVLTHNISIFFAVALPIVLFVVARIVYYQLGVQAQYDLYYSRAQDAARQALAEASPATARVEWQATLDWLDKADQFQTKSDPVSQKFRLEAQTALDHIDAINRVNFIPAFDSAPGRSVHVSRISATDTDVYFLDAVTGSVYRGVYNGHNYDFDKTYQCGPGIYNNKIQVGQLVDIVALPKYGLSNNSTLLGIDVNGNLIYCLPGRDPNAAVLQMPGTGWKGITAVAFNENTLYVLDAPARGVWFYEQDGDKLAFTGEPKIFFGQQIPVMLEQAIGMAVNGNDLYLLHKDGHLATCQFSHDSSVPTRCNDPALYVDSRPGFQGQMNLTDGVFSQIAFTSVPVQSVALLEPFSQSIYRFSPRALELQNQIRPNTGKSSSLPGGQPVTAMAFSPNKILFVYVDGQMYFSLNAP